MSAFVEAWPCVVGNVGPTKQLAGMGTLLAAAYPPASANGRMDQMWPWSAGHGVGTQAAPTTHAGVGLHSQAGNTPPPTTTDSRSTSPLQHQSPDFHQDDDLRAPSPLQHTKGPSEPESKGEPKNQKPRRKMQDHPGSRKKQPAAAAQAALPSSSSPSQDASNVKPKKRERKPKNPLPKLTVTPPQQHDEFEDDDDFDDDHLEFDDIDEEDLPRDPRRRRTLERNRIAARKCRVRKRDEASALASREQAVEDQNRYLSTTYNSLTTEVYLLKTELLRHTHCNCKLIQEYIANEARRSVDKMNASPSSSQSHHLSTPTNLHNQTRRSSYFETEPGSFDGHSTPTEPVKNAWNNGFVPVDGTATPFQHVCNHQHSHQPVAQDGPHHDGSFGHIHHGHYGQPQYGVPGQFHDVAHCQMDTNVNMAGSNEQLNDQGFGPFFDSQTNFGPSFTKEQ